jgi:hypothetical protein
MTVLNLDLTGVSDAPSFLPLPAGWYPVHAVGVAIEHSKTSGDPMLKYELDVISGQYANRRLFERIMLAGKGFDYGKRKLKSFATACGHPNPNYIQNGEELLQRPCYVRVSLRQREGFQDDNEIKEYMSERGYMAKHGQNGYSFTAMAAQAASQAAPAYQPPAYQPPPQQAYQAPPQQGYQAPPPYQPPAYQPQQVLPTPPAPQPVYQPSFQPAPQAQPVPQVAPQPAYQPVPQPVPQPAPPAHMAPHPAPQPNRTPPPLVRPNGNRTPFVETGPAVEQPPLEAPSLAVQSDEAPF